MYFIRSPKPRLQNKSWEETIISQSLSFQIIFNNLEYFNTSLYILVKAHHQILNWEVLYSSRTIAKICSSRDKSILYKIYLFSRVNKKSLLFCPKNRIISSISIKTDTMHSLQKDNKFIPCGQVINILCNLDQSESLLTRQKYINKQCSYQIARVFFLSKIKGLWFVQPALHPSLLKRVHSPSKITTHADRKNATISM